MSDVVEAMARALLARRGFGFYTNPMEGGQDAYDISCEAIEEARAAIRACHAAGGLVVGKMPGDAPQPASVTGYAAGVLGGYNTALREVRAAAVEVE